LAIALFPGERANRSTCRPKENRRPVARTAAFLVSAKNG